MDGDTFEFRANLERTLDAGCGPLATGLAGMDRERASRARVPFALGAGEGS